MTHVAIILIFVVYTKKILGHMSKVQKKSMETVSIDFKKCFFVKMFYIKSS